MCLAIARRSAGAIDQLEEGVFRFHADPARLPGRICRLNGKINHVVPEVERRYFGAIIIFEVVPGPGRAVTRFAEEGFVTDQVTLNLLDARSANRLHEPAEKIR